MRFKLYESYASQKAVYLKQGANPAEVDEYIKYHKFLKDRKDKILTQELPSFNAVDVKNRGNIDFFKTFSDLKNFISDVEKLSPIKNKMAAQDQATENSKYLAAKERFIKQGKTAEEIDQMLNSFKRLLKANKDLLSQEIEGISVPIQKRQDINAYANFADLERVVDEALNAAGGKKGYDVEFKEAKVIYDDDKLAIYRALNPHGCIEIKGSHPTSWCVSRSDLGTNMYYNYRRKEHKPTFYFVKNKEKMAAEGTDVKHGQYKDKYHFFALEVHEPKDNKDNYTIVSAANGDDTDVSWNDVVKIEPLLADKKSLFVWVPYTDEEDIVINLADMTEEEFVKMPYEKKALAVNVSGYLPYAKFKLLPDDLKKLYISTGKTIDTESLDLIRQNKDQYAYLIGRYMTKPGLDFKLEEEFVNHYKDNPVLQKYIRSGEIFKYMKSNWMNSVDLTQRYPEQFLQFFVDNFKSLEPQLDVDFVNLFANALTMTKSRMGGGAPEIAEWSLQNPAFLKILNQYYEEYPQMILDILANVKDPAKAATLFTDDALNKVFGVFNYNARSNRLRSRVPGAEHAFDDLVLKHGGENVDIMTHGSLTPEFLKKYIKSGKPLKPWDALTYLSLIKQQFGSMDNKSDLDLKKLLGGENFQMLQPALAKLTDANVFATMMHHEGGGSLIYQLKQLTRYLKLNKLSIFDDELDANTIKKYIMKDQDTSKSEDESLKNFNLACHNIKFMTNVLLKYGKSLGPTFRHNLEQINNVCGINSAAGLGQSMGIKNMLDQPYRPSWGTVRKESLSSFKAFLEFIESI